MLIVRDPKVVLAQVRVTKEKRVIQPLLPTLVGSVVPAAGALWQLVDNL